MKPAPVIQVVVRTFGLHGRDSGRTRTAGDLSGGTTVSGLLTQIRSRATPDDRLVTVHPDALLVLVNGRPIEYLDGWDTVLRDRDEIAYLLKTAGG